MRSRIPWTLLAAAGLVLSGHAAAQSIREVTNETGDRSWANSVSADGSIVCGCTELADGMHAFRWTAAGGLQDIVAPPGSCAWRISADGSTIIGDTDTPFAFLGVFRWSAGSGIAHLPNGFWGTNHDRQLGVNADGSFVVGIDVFDDSQAARWTSNGVERFGMLPDDTESHAMAVSSGGDIVVGASGPEHQDGLEHAFRWTAPGGMEDLGVLPGFIGSEARAVSLDGSTITGRSWPDQWMALAHAVRWRAGELSDLGVPDGFDLAHGDSVSADGSVILGTAIRWEGFDAFAVAFTWTQDSGIVLLRDHLAALGVDVSGWELNWPSAISADGRTIVGTGHHLGLERGWIVTLPPWCASADFNHDGDSGTDADIEAFFACLSGSCCPTCGSADFNGDGDVGTDTDIESFFRVLAGGLC